MLFKYRAVDPKGRIIRGKLEATNPIDLEGRLSRISLDLIDAAAIEYRPSLFASKNIKRQDLITFCFHLEQLTRAGVPLLDGLVDLRDSIDHPTFREIIANVVEDIEGGQQLSQALSAHPKVFDTVFVNLIRAGEASGQLPDVLKNLVETLKWQDELAAQTKKLLMYPAFVGTIVVGVTLFLLIWLVPQLVKFIRSMQQELPLQTRVLIAISEFLQHHWWVLPLIPVAILAGMAAWKALDPRYQFRVDYLKLKMPFIGGILEKIVMARLANYFALLYGAGITILECIRILEGVVGNLTIGEGLTEVRDQIAEGQSVTNSFERVRMFPPLVLRMLRVGEDTGAIDTSLQNVAYFYNRDVKESIEKIQALIEPVMTVVLGLILGTVMLSVLGPIYDLITKIKT
ncbi:type II secretion system F family protein [Parachitinimonas caeni]|uniref:Type II secretion system F family protein n=1 Tax=Parachitinimonas caeni TaxID=3031301 RepID=A0ABT7DSX3_9NEIS|nr:type II secretion system F family protein [Parachitinimonas caeni]MDK2123167.1 type II secretion system F family protein [Parachitinimonas caeni]